MSLLDTLVDATAALFRQLFGGPQAPAPTETTSDGSTPPTSGDVVQPASVAPAVPEAPAGAGIPDLYMMPAGAVQRIMPNLSASRCSDYMPFISAAMVEFAINTPLRAAAFLAQIAVESNQLTAWTENLNYGASGLLATFPTHFTTPAEADSYARQPERIANRVYGGRMGNGPEESGDGWRYRGRGPIALTGHDNYQAYGAALGVDLVGDPDLAATPEIGFRVAGRYWSSNGCNELADAGDFIGVTRRVNGGLTGLASREAYYRVAKEALGVA